MNLHHRQSVWEHQVYSARKKLLWVWVLWLIINIPYHTTLLVEGDAVLSTYLVYPLQLPSSLLMLRSLEIGWRGLFGLPYEI